MARDALVVQWWRWHGTLAAVAASGDEYGMRAIWHRASGAAWALFATPDMDKAAGMFFRLADRAFNLLQKRRDAKEGGTHHD